MVHAYLNIAMRAADEAGKSLLQSSKRLSNLKIDVKGMNNIVSNADREAESIIIGHIQEAYPDHGIIAEESGKIGDADAETVWVIDPLDGTFNFVHGLPHYAVSIGCMVKGKFEHGVIFDPVRDEMFVASSGSGAYVRHLNSSNRLRVRKIESIRGSLVGSSGGYDCAAQESMLNLQSKLIAHKAVVRKSGSAALDLAYVAAGRLDGYIALNLSLWDYAAGIIIIKEAGGIVTDLTGSGDFIAKQSIVAAGPVLTRKLISAFDIS